MFIPKYLISFLACWNFKNSANCVFFVAGVSFPASYFYLEFVLNSDTFSKSSVIVFFTMGEIDSLRFFTIIIAWIVP